MLETWPQIVFGWPGAIAGAALLLVGLALRRAVISAIGAALSAGFCVYVAANPMPFRFLGLLALAGNIGSAVALRRRSEFLAAALLLPFSAVACYAFFRLSDG